MMVGLVVDAELLSTVQAEWEIVIILVEAMMLPTECLSKSPLWLRTRVVASLRAL